MLTSTLANCLAETFESVVEDHNGNRYEVFDILNTQAEAVLATQASFDHDSKQITNPEGLVLYRVV